MHVYIGLDVSLASTAICVVSAQGKIVKENTAASEPEDLVATLKGDAAGRLRQVQNTRTVQLPLHEPQLVFDLQRLSFCRESSRVVL